MMEQQLSFADYLAILNRRKWQFIVPAILIFVISIAIALALPTLYRSTATILIEQQEVPMDLVRSTITTYADRRIELIKQRVTTTENLTPIIERRDLYADLRHDREISSAIDRMRRDIVVETISAHSRDGAIAFSIAYEADSPTLAQQVANDLSALFLEENVRERQRTTQEISRFLDQESTKLAEQVSTLEAKLASFKEQHGDAIPEMMDVNMQLLQRTEDRLNQTNQEIQTLEVNQVYLQSELGKLSPRISISLDSSESDVSPTVRLETLETELLRLSSRYSDAHPDRIAVEREVEALRREVGGQTTGNLNRLLSEQRKALSDLRSRRSNEHPDVKAIERQIAATERKLSTSRVAGAANRTTDLTDANNPLYIQMQSQLSANRSTLEALRKTRDALEERLVSIESRIAEGPKIEREYRLITRDYEGAVDKYKQVRSKHMEAVLAESLESESKGERYVLIEPPVVPDRPSSPNLLKVLLLCVASAIGGGLGIITGLEFIDGRIYSTRAMQGVTGTLPMAVIPFIETDEDLQRWRLQRVGFALGFIAILALSIMALQMFVMPLDELWIKIVTKIGSIQTGIPG